VEEDADSGGGVQIVERVEPQRPITELLEGWFGESATVRLIANSVDVISQALIIILVAWIASLVVRRVIRRAVRRAGAEPAAPPHGRGKVRRTFTLRDADGSDLSLRRAQRAKALGAMAESISRATIWAIAFVTILGTTFGVNLGPLIAGAGIIGIALGFGAQGLVRDFLSGVSMLAEDQFGVGDTIDVGDATGVVEGVSLRTTRVRDVTGTLWHVPNGEIRRVGNMSQEWSRALLDIGIAYGADIDTAAEIIGAVATDMAHEPEHRESFLDEPEVWGVENLGADSVAIRLVIKTQPGRQWAIARELRRRIKNAFDAAGIEIPFSQRTVWLRTEQPVSFGGRQVPPFAYVLPGEEAIESARQAARRGDTSAPVSDFDEVRGEVLGDPRPPRGPAT
jgi:moderate conductance mechanosensitive channel